MRSPLSSFYLQHLGGAISRGGAATAAFGHRDAVFERTRAAYAPETYERLVALKQAYDPYNVFRLNQNIAPRRA